MHSSGSSTQKYSDNNSIFAVAAVFVTIIALISDSYCENVAWLEKRREGDSDSDSDSDSDE